MNLAERLDCFPVVTDCAIQGRLRLLECASFEEQEYVLEESRGIAEEVIRGELAHARLMSPAAHRMLMHPGRRAKLGQRAPQRRRDRHHGHLLPPSPFARMGGEYWLTCRLIYYVVDNGRVIAAQQLTQNQLDTIREFGDLPGPDQPHMSILELVQQSLEDLPASGIQPVPSLCAPESKPIMSRSALPIPRWMERPGADWTLLVLDTDEPVATAVRRVNRWMRKEFHGKRPEPVFAERARAAVGDVMDALRETRNLRSSDIPKLRGVNRHWPGIPLSACALRWWNRMFRHVSPSNGKLVMLVTPDTARKMLSVIDDSPRTSWRTNPATVSHGHAFRITWDIPTSRFAITDEKF